MTDDVHASADAKSASSTSPETTGPKDTGSKTVGPESVALAAKTPVKPVLVDTQPAQTAAPQVAASDSAKTATETAAPVSTPARKAPAPEKTAPEQPTARKPPAKSGTRKAPARAAARKPVKTTSRKPAPKKAPRKPLPTPPVVGPVSPGFSTQARHIWMVITFLIFVAAPTGTVWWYLDNRAADQYASTVGFVVRQADAPAAVGGGLLGSIASLSGGSSSDTDILYEFIQSQQLIELVIEKIDLRAIYNKPENDPIFTLGDSASIEDIIWYWSQAVKIFYDPGTGLIELRVLAFTPEDAQNIAREIAAQSSAMINKLSAIARSDTTRYASEELDKAVARLRETRQTLTAFRNSSQIVDPTADVQGRMGLLNYLQQKLADTIIEQDLLQDTARENDPRLQQTQRTIAVIQERIGEERQKIGLGDSGTGEAFSNLVGEYEGLIVDREFAEQAYVAALSNYDAAIAEANRQSRYLASYINPTISEEAQYPKRYLITTLLALFLFLLWFVLLLIYYGIRDRR